MVLEGDGFWLFGENNNEDKASSVVYYGEDQSMAQITIPDAEIVMNEGWQLPHLEYIYGLESWHPGVAWISDYFWCWVADEIVLLTQIYKSISNSIPIEIGTSDFLVSPSNHPCNPLSS